MKTKDYSGATLKTTEDGIVEALVAVYGNEDYQGDIIHYGAFSDATKRPERVRVLDQHQGGSTRTVIGVTLALRELAKNELPYSVRAEYPDATGALWARAQFLLETPEGKGAFQRVKTGAVSQWSVGFDVLDSSYRKVAALDGKARTVRDIFKAKLYEYSSVIFAANEATTTISVKGGGPSLRYLLGEWIEAHKRHQAELRRVYAGGGNGRELHRLALIEQTLRAQVDLAIMTNAAELDAMEKGLR